MEALIKLGMDGKPLTGKRKGKKPSSLPAGEGVVIDVGELVELCGADPMLYAVTFFPKAFRMPPADFHPGVWELLEGGHRLVNLQLMRDGAKTTILRCFTSRRIAYGLSFTILYLGKSDEHAHRSVEWIAQAARFNHQWRTVYNISFGKKDSQGEVALKNKTLGREIRILGMGITGSVRGINIGDYRPDLIIVDDVIDDEMAASPTIRKKVSDRIHGAVRESLAPATENPHAMLAMLQTPLSKGDPSTLALSDPEFASARYGCWTPETENLALDERRSSWEARYPTETLRKQKEAAIRRGKGHIFAREKEVRLTTPETVALRPEWRRAYDVGPDRGQMTVVMTIDPVPPPSPKQLEQGLAKKDYESFAVVGRHQGHFFDLDYRYNRGHDPSWTIKTFFELASEWRPRKILIETVAYQRTLKWLLDSAMQTRREYFVLDEIKDDKRSKFDVIVDALSGPGSQGKIFIRNSSVELISQWDEYPNVEHDDILETFARGVEELHVGELDEEDERLEGEEKGMMELDWGGEPLGVDWRACP